MSPWAPGPLKVSEVGGDGGLLGLSFPLISSHPWVEASLWDAIFHLKPEQRSGGAAVRLAVWDPVLPVTLADCMTFSESLHPLGLSCPSVCAMRVPCDLRPSTQCLRCEDAHIGSPTYHPKPLSARHCARQSRGKGQTSRCPQCAQNSEVRKPPQNPSRPAGPSPWGCRARFGLCRSPHPSFPSASISVHVSPPWRRLVSSGTAVLLHCHTS